MISTDLLKYIMIGTGVLFAVIIGVYLILTKIIISVIRRSLCIPQMLVI